MAERIQDSSAFEGRDRLKILVTLNTVLFLVVTCLAVEVLARLIGSLPLFYGLAGVKNFGKQHGTPWYMYQWLEVSWGCCHVLLGAVIGLLSWLVWWLVVVVENVVGW